MEKNCKKNRPKKIPKKIFKKKKNSEIFREFFFTFFLPNGVLRPIWSMPAKIWGGSRPAGLGGDRDCTNST
jgi:hypothetical protein